MGNRVQSFSSTFPGGWPGVGLLLLRIAVGVTAVVQGGIHIDGGNPTIATWAVSLLAIASGISLLVGFQTPIASATVGVAAICLAFSSSSPEPNLFDAALPTTLVVVIAAAVVFLGPGALSIDARRFGRREIIIPRTPSSSKP